MAGTFARLTSVLGRRGLMGGLVFRLAPITYLGVRARRLWMRRTPLVTIVGSLGKTTTTRCIRAALGQLPASDLGTSVWFAGWAVFWHRPRRSPLVLEAGIDRPGQMKAAAAAFQPDAVVVTSIAHEHLTSFRTLEALVDEKVAMVRALRPAGTAFLNGDDPLVLGMREGVRGRVVTFGFDGACDVRADDLHPDDRAGTTFTMHIQGQAWPVRTPLHGRPGVYAALAGVGVAVHLGVEPAVAIARLASLTSAPGRLQLLASPSGATVIRDDFKSSWETMLSALEVVAGMPARRRVLVLGDISEVPAPVRQSYRTIGMRVAEVADRLVVVGRKTQLVAYRAGVRAAATHPAFPMDGTPAVHEAVAFLPADLGPGDLVLIKGRRSQRLERVALLLQGREVGCRLTSCRAIVAGCDTCPMLASGWPDGQWRYPDA